MPTTNHAIDSILLPYQPQLGDHYDKYRNHVQRVFYLASVLSASDEDGLQALTIAAAFHDIGIWTAKTFNYLSPSTILAQNHLEEHGLSHLETLVVDIINNHHKLSAYKLSNTVEVFRQADLIDLSFGLFRFGVKARQLKEMNALFPSLGFRRFILMQALKNTIRNPMNPLPMMKR